MMGRISVAASFTKPETSSDQDVNKKISKWSLFDVEPTGNSVCCVKASHWRLFMLSGALVSAPIARADPLPKATVTPLMSS